MLVNQFLLELILKHLMIIEELYANEYQPYDKLWELKEGMYKIYRFLRYLKSSHFLLEN